MFFKLHAILCFSIVFAIGMMSTACLTPINYCPIKGNEKDFVSHIDQEVVATLLAKGEYRTNDGETILKFSKVIDEDENSSFLPFKEAKSLDYAPEKVFLHLNMITKEEDKNNKGQKEERNLPLFFIPFRQNEELFALISLNQVEIVLKNNLSPMYLFMQRPFYYIAKIEFKEEGKFQAKMVQFASFDLKSGNNATKKHSPWVKLDEDGVVMNSPEEIRELLKNPQNYELAIDGFNFSPAKK